MNEYMAKPLEIIDANTVLLEVDLGFNTRVPLKLRLMDIEAMRRPLNQHIKDVKVWLEEILLLDDRNQEVLIETRREKKGDYSCLIFAMCEEKAVRRNLNMLMMQKGLATQRKVQT